MEKFLRRLLIAWLISRYIHTDVTRSIESFNKRHAYQTMRAGGCLYVPLSLCYRNRDAIISRLLQRPQHCVLIFILSPSPSLRSFRVSCTNCETVDSSVECYLLSKMRVPRGEILGESIYYAGIVPDLSHRIYQFLNQSFFKKNYSKIQLVKSPFLIINLK